MEYDIWLASVSFCVSLVMIAFLLTAREFARMQSKPAMIDRSARNRAIRVK